MIDHVRPRELPNWLHGHAARAPAVVLDVREPWELQTASIQSGDFTLLSIPMGELTARLQELDPDRPIACLCHHGARSLRVANFLHGHGFAHVANLTGGINAWSSEVDATVPTY